ncbi:MAG TPA: hypothetical protein VGC79_14200 [Polyangiaceae bacterium]
MGTPSFLTALIVLICCSCSSDPKDSKPETSATETPVASCSAVTDLSAKTKDHDLWFVYGTPGACAAPTCIPNAERACARLEAPQQAKAGVGIAFQKALDLTANAGMLFTADVQPEGAPFSASIASNTGAHGITWTLTAQSGVVTYQVEFSKGYVWTHDSVAFDLAQTEAFDVSNEFAGGGDITVTLLDVKSW